MSPRTRTEWAIDWLGELVTAADELGYGVQSIDMRSSRVVLVPLDGNTHRDTVALEGIFVSGDLLRRRLRSLREGAS